MTDAGFNAPWFKLIEARGWRFLGRIRGRNRLQIGENGAWIPARDLGPGRYVQSNPVAVHAVLAKRPRKERHALTIYGKQRKSRTSLRCARAAREPWLLVSSRGLASLTAATLVSLYAQRMRIEQWNVRVGLGLETARSRSRERFEMLLLLAHFAFYVQRLIGESARTQQLELQFMARRREDRHEISVLTLARRILDVAPAYLRELAPWQAIPPLAAQAASAYAGRR